MAPDDTVTFVIHFKVSIYNNKLTFNICFFSLVDEDAVSGFHWIIRIYHIFCYGEWRIYNKRWLKMLTTKGMGFFFICLSWTEEVCYIGFLIRQDSSNFTDEFFPSSPPLFLSLILITALEIKIGDADTRTTSDSNASLSVGYVLDVVATIH